MVATQRERTDRSINKLAVVLYVWITSVGILLSLMMYLLISGE